MLLSMALIFFFVEAVTETTKNFDFNSVNVYLHESVTDLFFNAQDQPNLCKLCTENFRTSMLLRIVTVVHKLLTKIPKK